MKLPTNALKRIENTLFQDVLMRVYDLTESEMEEELVKRYYRIVGKGGYAYRYEGKTYARRKNNVRDLC